MPDFFLADDLSGALDAAAAFRANGRRVTIVLTPDDWSAAQPGDIVGVTTETRNAQPDQASAVVGDALKFARSRGARLLYKKIDSTLRGPVAAELAALLRALPETRILFTPANPAVGRTVRGGILYVHGIPVAETEFARDPVAPVTHHSIRELLGSAAESRVIVADASSDSDLAAAVARMDSAGPDWVAVGSGALARPVAARMLERNAVGAQPPRAQPARVLYICGSTHPINRRQAAVLEQRFAISMHQVSPDISRHAETDAIADFEMGRDPGLWLPERVPGGKPVDSSEALAAITEAAVRVIEASGIRHLLVTGGETAFAICRRLGISALSVREEIEPGLVLAEAAAAGEKWRVAIKPGAFGSERAWLLATERLRSS
jgi:uncharacterized protein YgbK (DUF1537 family)